MNRIKVLHITPHLGGGVGRVLLNYLRFAGTNPYFAHMVACLDYANPNAKAKADIFGLNLYDLLAKDVPMLNGIISKADIVLVHWWNHPLLFDFLVRNELPPCRMAMWSHISGFNLPNIFTSKILAYPDMFVFTTPVSYKTQAFDALAPQIQDKIRVVWSTAGVEHVSGTCDFSNKKSGKFNVGYIGTVDYCKLHPGYLDICSRIDIPNVHFWVCGGHDEKNICQQALEMGMNQKMTFTGYVDDILGYLSKFDVLGYPLAPYHYGTCDQVLAESMACGVVPVVLANRMESYMIRNRETGIVAKDEQDYIKAVQQLYHDVRLRADLSAKAVEYARKTFTLEKLDQEWSLIFERLMKDNKEAKKWDIKGSRTKLQSSDVFLESLGEQGQIFASCCNAKTVNERDLWLEKIGSLGSLPSWHTSTKGSVHHYSRFFPQDDRLTLWRDAMLNCKQDK